MDIYGESEGIIADCVPEIQLYMDEVLPTEDAEKALETELLDIVIDTSWLTN